MSTLLFVAGQPNGRNEVYDAGELERLAAKYPDKMVYANGELHSTAPVEDDDHHFRWAVSIAHHVERMHVEDRHVAVTQILEGVKALEKQLAYRVGRVGRSITLTDFEYEHLRRAQKKLRELLEDQKEYV